MTRGVKINCPYCGRLFSGRATQKFCSFECRERASYQRLGNVRATDDVELVYILRANAKRADAKSRGLEFNLTAEFIKDILTAPCRYCGNTSSVLERYDNDIGYTEINVVPSCSPCNSLKHQMFGGHFIKMRSYMSNGIIPCAKVKPGVIIDVKNGDVYVLQQELSGQGLSHAQE